MPDLRTALLRGVPAVLHGALPGGRSRALADRRVSHPGSSGRTGRRSAAVGRYRIGARFRGLIAGRAWAKHPPPTRSRLRPGDAQVAQLVEHATENRSVGGSIPPLGTILKSLSFLVVSHQRPPAEISRFRSADSWRSPFAPAPSPSASLSILVCLQVRDWPAWITRDPVTGESVAVAASRSRPSAETGRVR